MWWLDAEERMARVEQPSEWMSKLKSGGIKVSGHYEGEEDQAVIFRIEGSGQIGGTQPVWLHYEFAETGESGRLNLSAPYGNDEEKGIGDATAFDAENGAALFDLKFNKEGPALSIGKGLFIHVPLVVVNDGDTAVVDVRAPKSDKFWWFDEEYASSGRIDEFSNWTPYAEFEGLDEDELEELGIGARPKVDDLIRLRHVVSEAEIHVSGEYVGDTSNTYTFEVKNRGNVGETESLEIDWKDENEKEGTIEVGVEYVPGTPLDFDKRSGLSIAFGKGELFKTDTFELAIESSTVRNAQDLVMHIGASRQGGGLEVRRANNQVNDLIPGVELEVLDSSDDPVTISVLADTDTANGYIHDFVDAYNTLNATVTEVTKYDPQTEIAGPLLSDRNLAQLTNEITTTTISSVAGLPQSDNMLFAIGLKINDQGVMNLDESKLDEKINTDFDAVANIFRSHGDVEGTGISFLGISDKTKISPEGYKIEITKPATRSTLTGNIIGQEVIQIDNSNNQFYMSSNGRRSEIISLRNDFYSIESLAKTIQNQLALDKVIGKRDIRVEPNDGKLKFISGSYGAISTLNIEPAEKKSLAPLGLQQFDTVNGTNVEGLIDGIAAQGRGQLLIGSENTEADGMRLFVSLTEDQLKAEEEEASVIVSKGIAFQLKKKLERINNSADGDMKLINRDLVEQVRSYDRQAREINERIDAKREQLQIKFARLDNTMGRLKAQQSYLTQQISALGQNSGGKGDK